MPEHVYRVCVMAMGIAQPTVGGDGKRNRADRPMRWWLIALALWIAWVPIGVALFVWIDRTAKWITRRTLPSARRGQIG